MNNDSPHPDNSEEKNIAPPLTDAPELATVLPVSRRRRIAFVVVIMMIILALIGTITFLVLNQKAPSHSSNGGFPALTKELNHDELFATAMERLQSVDQISYDVEAKGVYDSNVKIKFKPNTVDAASATTYYQGSQNVSTEVISKDKDFYFRYTQMGHVATDGTAKYLNKWILANETTSQGVGAGTEYYAMFLTAPSSLEVPLFIGTFSQPTKDNIKNKMQSGLHKVSSAENVQHNGQKATKYVFTWDKVAVQELSTQLYNNREKDTSSYMPFGFSQIDPQSETTATVTMIVDPKNAQLIEVNKKVDTGDSPSIPSFSSSNITYRNISFSGVVVPEAPKDAIPLNEFYGRQ